MVWRDQGGSPAPGQGGVQRVRCRVPLIMIHDFRPFQKLTRVLDLEKVSLIAITCPCSRSELGEKLFVPKLAAPERSAFSASDPEWAEAVRREAIIRPLSASGRLGRGAIKAAAVGARIERAACVRAAPTFPRTSGDGVAAAASARSSEGRAASCPLPWKLRSRRRLTKCFSARSGRRSREFGPRRRGRAVWPRSNRLRLKALRARISARSLRERVKAREGAEAAGNRFRQVRTGLRTERRLQVVQIDHTKVDIMLVDDVTRAWHRSALADTGAGRAHAHGGRLPPVARCPECHGGGLGDRTSRSAETVLVEAARYRFRRGRCTGCLMAFTSITAENSTPRAFERGCQQHGIRIEYRPPATPRFGGHIERLMGTLMGRGSRLSGFDVVQLRRSREL